MKNYIWTVFGSNREDTHGNLEEISVVAERIETAVSKFYDNYYNWEAVNVIRGPEVIL